MSKYSKAEVEYRVNAPKVAQAVVSFPNTLKVGWWNEPQGPSRKLVEDLVSNLE